MTLVKGLVEDLFEDIADVTLIDEDTKPVLTDDDNKEIPSNMTMHVASPGVQFSFLETRRKSIHAILFEHLAEISLIDENTQLILTDDP